MTNGNGTNLLAQGRIVWVTGKSLFEGQPKVDFNTKQPKFAADGSPIQEYGFGLAISKADPEFQNIWNALHQEAFTLYPNGQIPPGFAMKFKDGDGIDHNGRSFADREGYAGHIVLACTTQIPIKFFRFEGGNNILVNDGIKCGDYVNVQLNVKAHPAKGQGKPGLYVNPSAVQLIQPGAEIINTPSGDAIFGQAAPSYAGQMVADTAPTMPSMTPGMPAQQQAPAQPAMPGMSPQPQMTPPAQPAMPGMSPQPQMTPPAHYGVLPETMQQPQMTAPAMPGIPQQQQAPAMPGMPAVPTPQ